MTTVAFLADDLTGASDVIAQAHARGLEAVLVLDPAGLPGPGEPVADVVGLAAPIRSLRGEALDRAVREGLAALAPLSPGVLLYKVCSTFDSSPTVGSIGRAVELLAERYADHGPVPVVPAQPSFGRHTAFSQHFGAHDGVVHRLDRHPVMSRHPSTPMGEADLRRVLAEQLTGAPAVPGLHLTDDRATRWAELRADGGAPAYVVDAVTEADLDEVADLLLAEPHAPALVVGSGGVMGALARRLGDGRSPVAAVTGPPAPPGASGPVLTVSASASSTTARQLRVALDAGWVDVPLDLGASDEPGSDVLVRVAAALRAGEHVAVHTALGPDDPRLRTGHADAATTGALIGRIAGRMAADDLTRDVAVCGGDTSGHALLTVGVRRLRVAEQLVPVGPVCRPDDDSDLAGCRLLLKGGQVGPPDVLLRFARPADHQDPGRDRR